MDIPNPIKWVEIPPEIEYIRAEKSNHVMSEPFQLFLPKNMLDIHHQIYNFELRSDDIWILSYPKCGSNWTQEMVWQIVNKINLELPFEIPLLKRSPLLEMQVYMLEPEMTYIEKLPKEDTDWLINSIGTLFCFKKLAVRWPIYKISNFCPELTKMTKSPRIIKSHLPLEFLPPKLLETCKVIYVGRNPKDVCVSYYNHMKISSGVQRYEFDGTFEAFVTAFMNGTVEYGSFWTMLKVNCKLF